MYLSCTCKSHGGHKMQETELGTGCKSSLNKENTHSSYRPRSICSGSGTGPAALAIMSHSIPHPGDSSRYYSCLKFGETESRGGLLAKVM